MTLQPLPPKSCPVCNADNPSCNNEQYEDGNYYVDLRCPSCDSSWTEIYQFTDFIITEQTLPTN